MLHHLIPQFIQFLSGLFGEQLTRVTFAPVYFWDFLFQEFNVNGWFLFSSDTIIAVHVHVVSLFPLTSPVLAGVWIAGEGATEYDSSILITRSQHIIVVAIVGIFPFIDTPVHATKPIGIFGEHIAVFIQLEAADARIPAQQICLWGAHRLHIDSIIEFLPLVIRHLVQDELSGINFLEIGIAFDNLEEVLNRYIFHFTGR